MSASEFKHKLRAILSADVAGYSRLMGDDDEATVKTLTGHREMMSSIINQNQGQVIDSPGDNLLAAFSSVTQAVDCAVEIQREMSERNAELPKDRVMEYRIGINLGEVIEEADRIYGDGVNIAARLESLAEPGGICISGAVYAQVKSKLKLEYEFLGKQTVKNISEPVPVYCIKSLPKSTIHIDSQRDGITQLSGKPSVAVLPFVNMSKDPDQEYFSDGIAEEIIGALAKLKGLKVISRTSAFYFKGEHVDLRTVGEKLKVDHVLEGSVRKAGNRVRITAQLIKVADDAHLWADIYDRELEDVFAIQDEISQAVVQSLKVKLLGKKDEPLVKDYTPNTEAYELFLKGLYFHSKPEADKSIEYFEKAIQIDPNYVPAYPYLAHAYNIVSWFYGLPPWENKPKINAFLERAIEIDESYGYTYVALAQYRMNEYDWPGTEKSYKRGIELHPSLKELHGAYSWYLAAVDRVDEAIQEARYAVELDPLSGIERCFLAFWLAFDGQFDQAMIIVKGILELDPNDRMGLWAMGIVYMLEGVYEEAISNFYKLKNVPGWLANLGFCYGKAGKSEEAQKILDDFLKLSKNGYFSPYLIATVYAGLAENDKAFKWLDRAYKVQDSCQTLIKMDPVFSDLHSDPRWQEALRKRNLAD